MPLKFSLTLETTRSTQVAQVASPPPVTKEQPAEVVDTPRRRLGILPFGVRSLPKLSVPQVKSEYIYTLLSLLILGAIAIPQVSNKIEGLILHGSQATSQAPATSIAPQQAFIRPVDDPISSPFGYRTHPIYGTRTFHKGTDFASATGTPIRAVKDGKVTLAGWVQGYGYSVELDHGSGVKSFYAHCSKILVRLGQSVSQGSAIALVGSTGNSTGPHLHFELDLNGTTVDPEEYLP